MFRRFIQVFGLTGYVIFCMAIGFSVWKIGQISIDKIYSSMHNDSSVNKDLTSVSEDVNVFLENAQLSNDTAVKSYGDLTEYVLDRINAMSTMGYFETDFNLNRLGQVDDTAQIISVLEERGYSVEVKDFNTTSYMFVSWYNE